MNCVQLKPLPFTFNSQVRPNSAIIVTHFSSRCCCRLAGWLLRDERGEICLLPCLVFAGQEKPLTAVLQHLNLPGIQPKGQVQQTEAFKHKASLQRSQGGRLRVKDGRGTHSEDTLNLTLSAIRISACLLCYNRKLD